MGLFGTTVLYPRGAPAPRPNRLETIARDILRAFERTGLLKAGTSDIAGADNKLVIAGVDEESSREALVHLAVDSGFLRPGLSDLIFTLTEAEYWEGFDRPDCQSTGTFVLPLLDVTVLSKRVAAVNFDASIAFRSWATIEFSYEGIHVHEEVNCIRNEGHPLFAELGVALKTNIDWAVVVR